MSFNSFNQSSRPNGMAAASGGWRLSTGRSKLAAVKPARANSVAPGTGYVCQLRSNNSHISGLEFPTPNYQGWCSWSLSEYSVGNHGLFLKPTGQPCQVANMAKSTETRGVDDKLRIGTILQYHGSGGRLSHSELMHCGQSARGPSRSCTLMSGTSDRVSCAARIKDGVPTTEATMENCGWPAARPGPTPSPRLAWAGVKIAEASIPKVTSIARKTKVPTKNRRPRHPWASGGTALYS